METEQRCCDSMVNRVVVLWTSIKVKGYPHANVPWARASKSKDGSALNLNDDSGRVKIHHKRCS